MSVYVCIYMYIMLAPVCYIATPQRHHYGAPTEAAPGAPGASLRASR